MGLDVLTQLFESICFDEAVAIVSELRAPWSITLPGNRLASLHATLEGSWLLDVPPDTSIPMRAGDIVLFPVDRLHHARDRATTEVVTWAGPCAVDRSGPTARLRKGGGGAQTRILSAVIPATAPRSAPAFGALPPIVLVRGDRESPEPAIAPIVRRLAEEVELRRPGHMLVARRLIEVLFVEVLRAQVDSDEASAGLLNALGDRRISAALAAIHRDAHKAFTVSELARVAGMSRSLFSARFTDLVGVTPHQYLVRLRMQRAAYLLRSQRLTILEVSAQVGYASESSFSRIFTREMGVPPAMYRKGAQGKSFTRDAGREGGSPQGRG